MGMSWDEAVAAVTGPGRALRDRRDGGARAAHARLQEHAAVAARALRRRARARRRHLPRLRGRALELRRGDGAASTRWRPRSSTATACAPGDRVAIAMRNYPEWVVAFAAITSIGAISVSLNAWWTADELDYALERLRAAASLIADRERAGARRAAACGALGVRVLAVRADGRAAGGRRALARTCVQPGAPMPEVDVAPGRRRHDPLHLGHHGPPEGRGLDPPRGALGARGLRLPRGRQRRAAASARSSRHTLPDVLHPRSCRSST